MTVLLALGLVAGVVLILGVTAPHLLLRLHRATPIADDQAPAAHLLLRELAQQSGIRRPSFSVMKGLQPNSFSVGRSSRATVVVTEAVFDHLSIYQLRALFAREIAQIAHDPLGWRSFLSVLAWLLSLPQRAHMRLFLPWHTTALSDRRRARAGVLFPLWAPLALAIVRVAFSGRRHLDVDERAASMLGDIRPVVDMLKCLEREAWRPVPSWAPATASLFAISPFGQHPGILRAFASQPTLATRVAHLRDVVKP